MNYDEELEYLKRGLKKITDKFHQAVAEGHEMYAEMWKEEIVDIEHRIHVYEQASKADEYEAKAKAYNDTLKTLDKLINNDERYKEARSNDFVAGMLIAYENIFNLMEDYIKESGEPDA